MEVQQESMCLPSSSTSTERGDSSTGKNSQKPLEEVCHSWMSSNCVKGDARPFLHSWIHRGDDAMLAELKGHKKCVSGNAGPWVFVGMPNTVKAWNIQNGGSYDDSGPVGQVHAVEVAQNMLFAGAQDGTILVWKGGSEADPFQKAAPLRGHSQGVVSLTVGRDRLYSGSIDQTIRVWDLYTLECVEAHVGHNDAVTSLLFWDQHLISCSLDRTVKVWVPTEGGSLQVAYTRHEDHGILALSWVNDVHGKPVLLCACNDNTVRLYDLPSFAVRGRRFSRGEVKTLRTAPGGLFFTGDSAGMLTVWHLSDFPLGQEEQLPHPMELRQGVSGTALPSRSTKLYPGTGQVVQGISLGGEVGCFTFGGPWVFVGMPNTVKAWNIQNGGSYDTSGPVGQVHAVEVAKNMLFVGAQDGTILVWKGGSEADPFQKAAPLRGHSWGVVSLTVGRDRLYSGSIDQTIRVWDLHTLECVEAHVGHNDAVTSLLFWDQHLISCSLDRTVKVWVPTEGGSLQVAYTHHEDHGILALSWVNDARGKPVLLCACNDNTVRLYDLPSFAVRGRRFSRGEVRTLRTAPGGLFFTGDTAGMLTVWDLSDFPKSQEEQLPHPMELRQGVSGIALPCGSTKLYPGIGQFVRGINFGGEVGCFTFEGPWVFVGMPNTVKAWNIQYGGSYGISGSVGQVHAVEVAKNMLFAGAQDGTILVWKGGSEVDPFQKPAPLRGHTRAVVSLTVGRDQLYSGSVDQTIRVWDLNTLECVEAHDGHNDAVTSLLFWDQYLISCSLDRTVKVWVPTHGGSLQVAYTHREDHGILALSVMNDARGKTVLLCACNDNTVRLYELPWFAVRGRRFSTREVRTLRTAPGGLFFTGDAAGMLTVWHLSDSPMSLEEQGVSGIALPSGSSMLYPGTGQFVRAIDIGGEVGCFTFEGPWVFVGMPNNVKAWNIQHGGSYDTSGPVGQFHAMEVAKNMLFAGAQDGTILVWKGGSEADPFQKAAPLRGHSRGVVSLTVGRGRLYSGSIDQTIRVWDLLTLECVGELVGHNDAVTSLLFWGQYLISCSLDRTVKVWVPTEGGSLQVAYTHREDHGILALSGMNDARGKPVLLCACNDNTVRLYELPWFAVRGWRFSRREVKTLWTAPGGLFFTGDTAGMLTVWHLSDSPMSQEEQLSHPMELCQGVSGIALPSGSTKHYPRTGQFVRAIDVVGKVGCFTFEGPWVFVGMANTVKAWNIQHGGSYDISGPVGQVHAMEVAKNMLFAGAQDGTILVWKGVSEADPIQKVAPLRGHTRGVVSLTVGHDRLYSGSIDQTVRVWDLLTLECVEELVGHTDVVTSLLFWDKYLISCSLDRTVKVWVPTEGGSLQVAYTHHEDHGILALSWVNDARGKPVLLCACNDNTVRLYELPSFARRGSVLSRREAPLLALQRIQPVPDGLHPGVLSHE